MAVSLATSFLFADQSNTVGSVNAGGDVNINQSIDSHNSFAASNNEVIKKIIISQKQDYPSLTQAQYQAMKTLASASLKIDIANKAKSEKIRECNNIGLALHAQIYKNIGVGIDFFNSKCKEFFSK